MITFQPTEHMDQYLLPQNIWEDVITSPSPDPMLDLVVKGFPKRNEYAVGRFQSEKEQLHSAIYFK